MPQTFFDVCSGIGGFHLAFEGLDAVIHGFSPKFEVLVQQLRQDNFIQPQKIAILDAQHCIV